MENAVKALLIAAGVLMGMVIVSIGVNLYSSLSKYVELTQNEIAMTELQQFNDQFFKYINYNENATNPRQFALTIQDIVTAANIAYENNQFYGLTEYKDGSYYVIVKLDGKSLEKNITSNSAQLLLNGLGYEYRCSSTDVRISAITGRVYEVNFYTYEVP